MHLFFIISGAFHVNPNYMMYQFNLPTFLKNEVTIVGPFGHAWADRSYYPVLAAVQLGMSRGMMRTLFHEVPGIFSLPVSQGIEFSTPHSPRSPPVVTEDPEKACFMIFYFFYLGK